MLDRYGHISKELLQGLRGVNPVGARRVEQQVHRAHRFLRRVGNGQPAFGEMRVVRRKYQLDRLTPHHWTVFRIIEE